MIVCIIGPTSVGKTRMSEELACRLDGIIINNDAMQVYREMNIGTAKYTKEEDLGQEHYLFDIVGPEEDYSVYDYQKDARKVLEENKDRNIVMVGGTGLYLKAALYDYEFSSHEIENFDDYSNLELYELLQKTGDISGVHVNNRRRLISRLNSSEHSNGKDRLLYDDVILIGLTTDRAVLHEKIEKRTVEMINGGLLKEVSTLYKKYGMTKALRTGICYKEVIAYFRGLLTMDEMTRLINQKCRQYAKRQYTWFNNQMDVKWFDVDYEDFSKTIDDVYNYIKSFKN